MSFRWLFAVMIASVFIFPACSSLSSTTYIEPHRSFLFGGGAHRQLKAVVFNPHNKEVKADIKDNQGVVLQALCIPAGATKVVQGGANNGLWVYNDGADTIAVKLRVTGDMNVGMQYMER